MNILAVAEGATNFLIRDEETERKYNERLLICNDCESKKTDLVDRCGQCGCPLATLLRQDIKVCDLNKWA